MRKKVPESPPSAMFHNEGAEAFAILATLCVWRRSQTALEGTYKHVHLQLSVCSAGKVRMQVLQAETFFITSKCATFNG